MALSASVRMSIFCFTVMLASMITEAQTKASCTFKVFQLPESTSSVAYGVNDYGAVVGLASYGGPGASGFTRTAGGKVTYYCAPKADCDVYSSFTYFTDHNNAGVAVGVYKTSGAGDPEGFLLNGSSFTQIREPKSVWGTFPAGINKSNTLVGSYIDYPGYTHGFRRSSGGSFKTLDFPGAQNTEPLGINDTGVIVGFYYPGHGFTYQGGNWATLDYPGASSTELNGISDANVIVGNSNATQQGTAFLYENGVFKVIAVPKMYSTSVNGISANGVIVGMTRPDNTQNSWRGFTATCQ